MHDNTLLRTLPASTSWQQWGYGAALWIGNNGDGSGFYTGGVLEGSLNYDGIRITGALCHSRIANNIIQTTGARGVYFDIIGNGGVVGDFDFDGLVIEGNVIRDFSVSGIDFSTPSISHQRITFRNNEFDGDPRFAHANRGVHGAWTSAAGPYGIFGNNLSSGGTMLGNAFRNVASPYVNAMAFAYQWEMSFTRLANPGFGQPTRALAIYRCLARDGWSWQEDSDPLSSTFAQVVGPSANMAPTTTYTASGAIALTDGRATLMSSSSVAMTLGNGTFDGQAIVIKNLGTATAVVTATIDGLTNNAVSLSAVGPIKDALRLSWAVSAATWIAE